MGVRELTRMLCCLMLLLMGGSQVLADRGGIECPPEGIPEGEPECYEDYEDQYNGGCGSDPTVYSPIGCDWTVCGETGTFLWWGSNMRDTDWYELLVEPQTNFTMRIVAECPIAIAIIDPVSGDCSDFEVLHFASGEAYEQVVLDHCALNSPLWWLWVGTGVFEGVPCGSEYVLSVECEPCDPARGACCLPDGSCVDELLEPECEAMDGLAWFANQHCDTAPCDTLPPINDDCENAIQVYPGAIEFDTTYATTDGPAHPECQFDGQTYHDIWYKIFYWQHEPGTLTVSTCGTAEYDTDLVVYEGYSCGELLMLGCNDDTAGCAGYTSEVEVPTQPHTNYYIRVGGYSEGDFGAGTLWLSTGYPPVGDLNCDNVVTFDDINPFVLALSGEEAYYAEFPDCHWWLADCNYDQQVNFDDIPAFVELMYEP